MNFYQTIQLNIPDDILHIHRCENWKLYNYYFILVQRDINIHIKILFKTE
jgi:hypothetical protein